MTIAGDEHQPGRTCTNAAMAADSGGWGASQGDQSPTIFRGYIGRDETGLVRPDVANVQIQTRAGLVALPAVSLEPLRVSGMAFGVVLPAETELMTFSFLDAEGNVLLSHDLR